MDSDSLKALIKQQMRVDGVKLRHFEKQKVSGWPYLTAMVCALFGSGIYIGNTNTFNHFTNIFTTPGHPAAVTAAAPVAVPVPMVPVAPMVKTVVKTIPAPAPRLRQWSEVPMAERKAIKAAARARFPEIDDIGGGVNWKPISTWLAEVHQVAHSNPRDLFRDYRQ